MQISGSFTIPRSKGTSTIPPPAPNRPFTAPAMLPAAIRRVLRLKKTPPEESVSTGGVFIQFVIMQRAAER
jgi:hypothetical protein